jgi:rhodanese-related sulfurtransferase/DNA-binding transcriptional ArsR family regulator
MRHRELKDPLYEQFARVGHAISSPKRIELLDLLSQGPKTVELLSTECATPLKNTSAHLRVLRQARLVETRREGSHVHYRLAGDDVVPLLRALKALAQSRLAEVDQVAALYLTQRDALEPVRLAELRRMVRHGEVTLIDVRPRAEYEAGHIPGAISVPVAELKRRLGEIPDRSEVIAYCRGPYCVFSVEAVGILRSNGYRARRAHEGLPEWKAEGWAVREGSLP